MYIEKKNLKISMAYNIGVANFRCTWSDLPVPWKKPSLMGHLWGTNVVVLVVKLGLLCDEIA